MAVWQWYTKVIYVSFVVILPHQNNLLLLALTLVQYDCYSIIQTNEFIALPIFSQFISFMR